MSYANELYRPHWNDSPEVAALKKVINAIWAVLGADPAALAGAVGDYIMEKAGDFAVCEECDGPLLEGEAVCPWCLHEQPIINDKRDADGPEVSQHLRRP